MAQIHEWLFYEVMWRSWTAGAPYPFPWWVQETLVHWMDAYDGGLFDSREAALASNALYRYWNLIGVKDNPRESLVGQAGEIEPVYDQYGISFFIFDPASRALHFPQMAQAGEPVPALQQQMQAGYLPVIVTTYRTPTLLQIEQRTLSTTVGQRQRAIVLDRLQVRNLSGDDSVGWLCIALTAIGPSGFQRHDRAGRYLQDGRISFLRYLPAEQRMEVNTRWGPVFDMAPAHVGLYGNPDSSTDPTSYLARSPFRELVDTGTLNGQLSATDFVGGLCTGVFAWPFELAPDATFSLDLRLPTDDYRGPDDLAELTTPTANTLEVANQTFWTGKLDGSGLQMSLPPLVAHLTDLFRQCRATLLILADEGEIHPGPTIYDDFWVRDSAVEGVAAALAGDTGLAATQFGYHYPSVFNLGSEPVGPASARGFFGGSHEKGDLEWDSNGEALWAFGRFDRIQGPTAAFGARMYSPYMVEGARWIRDNRDQYGLLHSGWSAEHLGDKSKPHYWDDIWALAGLYEAARMAERLGSAEVAELWAIFDCLKRATADSIRWTLGEQQRNGAWETFIPTGPADVGRLDSTMIGTVAYFHPTRLYVGKKLGDEIDAAARYTLETISSHFVTGGFRHDAAWNSYGPYLTLQLAHAWLLIGDSARMDQCLSWAVSNAAFAQVSRTGAPADRWQVVQGAWNEQHCYAVASNFAEMPNRWWYMGDIPHGWAAAELMLLMRDILFFEADEDVRPLIYLAAGVRPHWLAGVQSIAISDAPTTFGGVFGYELTHDQGSRTVTIQITQPPPAQVGFVYPCQFGQPISATADGQPVALMSNSTDIFLPPGTRSVTVRYV